jgi:hypothetical protein
MAQKRYVLDIKQDEAGSVLIQPGRCTPDRSSWHRRLHRPSNYPSPDRQDLLSQT